jgi:hypothetical protein
VVLVPGSVLAAEPAYAALLQVLGERVDAVAKDLEVYSGGQPPSGYGLDTEVDGILREANAHGFGRFTSSAIRAAVLPRSHSLRYTATDS